MLTLSRHRRPFSSCTGPGPGCHLLPLCLSHHCPPNSSQRHLLKTYTDRSHRLKPTLSALSLGPKPCKRPGPRPPGSPHRALAFASSCQAGLSLSVPPGTFLRLSPQHIVRADSREPLRCASVQCLPFSVLVPGLSSSRVFCSHPLPRPITNPVSPAAMKAGLPGRPLGAVPGLLPPCSKFSGATAGSPTPGQREPAAAGS